MEAFFRHRNCDTRLPIPTSSGLRGDDRRRDLLSGARPNALRMRWGAWTARGRAAGGGKHRLGGVGVLTTCVNGVIGQKTTGAEESLIFLEGGDGSAARWKTGCGEEDSRRSTACRLLRFSVRAPIEVRSWPENKESQ